KYADGLPLYRMESVLQRSGIDLDRTVMAHWMIKAGHLVQPLINLLRDHMLDYGIIQMDETGVQVLKEPDRPATSKSFMWVQRGGAPDRRIILFDYDPSRSGQVPLGLLTEYRGWLQTDGYSGYSAVGALPNVEHIGCWSHARRKFDEAVKAAGKGKKSKASEAIGMIQKLYAIEKRCRGMNSEERTKLRQLEVPPIFEEILNWMSDLAPKVLPGSATGKALAYLSGQWSKLIRYVEDGRLEIDNNSVENAIRPFVIGRKGWLFSNSVRGVKASANLYSLIETAKASGLEPYAYLRKVFSEIPNAVTVDDFEALLPWNVQKNSEKSKSP
ncbi:MAG: IS66 family transposase, partial [Nitrospirae bacterium]|nr:IS66 family transposase [Magnetococcales bacterium]